MKKVKLFSALMAALMLLSSAPAYAQTYTNGNTSGSITVTAVVGSTYEISLPATLTLTYDNDAVTNSLGYNYSAEYTVGVKANLTNAEKVTVTPAATFTMTNGSVSPTGNTTQTKTSWVNSATLPAEIAADRTQFVETTGKLTIQLDAAGTYNGSVAFTFAKGANGEGQN